MSCNTCTLTLCHCPTSLLDIQPLRLPPVPSEPCCAAIEVAQGLRAPLRQFDVHLQTFDSSVQRENTISFDCDSDPSRPEEIASVGYLRSWSTFMMLLQFMVLGKRKRSPILSLRERLARAWLTASSMQFSHPWRGTEMAHWKRELVLPVAACKISLHDQPELRTFTCAHTTGDTHQVWRLHGPICCPSMPNWTSSACIRAQMKGACPTYDRQIRIGWWETQAGARKRVGTQIHLTNHHAKPARITMLSSPRAPAREASSAKWPISLSVRYARCGLQLSTLQKHLFYPTHRFSSWHPVPKLNPEIGDLVTGTNAIYFTLFTAWTNHLLSVPPNLHRVMYKAHITAVCTVLRTCRAIDIMPATPYHGVSTPSGSVCATAQPHAVLAKSPSWKMQQWQRSPCVLMGSCPILATPLYANSPYCASLVPSQRPLACKGSWICCDTLAAPPDTRTAPRPPSCAPSTTSWSRITRWSTQTAHSRTWWRVWSSGRTSPIYITWTSWRKHNVLSRCQHL